MIALLQRVTSASVEVDDRPIAKIGAGLLAFIGVTRADDEAAAERLLERVLGYRMFAEAGAGSDEPRMSRSLAQTQGGLLLVPQFTLAADTSKGTRAGFSPAADPALARRLFEHLAERALSVHRNVQTGVFGARMRVCLINDGPVTFWLETPSAM